MVIRVGGKLLDSELYECIQNILSDSLILDSSSANLSVQLLYIICINNSCTGYYFNNNGKYYY
jgi:hypothetical protein